MVSQLLKFNHTLLQPTLPQVELAKDLGSEVRAYLAASPRVRSISPTVQLVLGGSILEIVR